jgi:hypothetical protein
VETNTDVVGRVYSCPTEVRLMFLLCCCCCAGLAEPLSPAHGSPCFGCRHSDAGFRSISAKTCEHEAAAWHGR